MAKAAGREATGDAACHLCIIHLRRTPKATCSGLDFDEFNLAFAQGSGSALSGINESALGFIWGPQDGTATAAAGAGGEGLRTSDARDSAACLYGSLTANEVERIMTRNLSSVSTAFR